MLNFAIAADAAYIKHASATATSIAINNHGARIFLIYEGVDDATINCISRSIARLKCQLIPMRFDRHQDIKNWQAHTHFSRAMYFRIFLIDMLPDHVENILYVDSDVIVRGPLASLFSTEMGDRPVAAVWNPCEEDVTARIGVRPENYFNSGVLLISVMNWRAAQISAKFIDIISATDHLDYPDQDALNIALDGQWVSLAATYNAQNSFFSNPDLANAYRLDLQSPLIMHFSGNRCKPWQPGGRRSPFAMEYFRYRLYTPWPFCAKERGEIIAARFKYSLFKFANWALRGKVRQQVKISASWVRGKFGSVKPRSISTHISSSKINNPRPSIAANLVSGDLILSGPFKGMKYLNRAHGSAHSPKVVGSYESPLHSVLHELFSKKFRKAVVIGCAEGYYAVGIALRMHDVVVHAFDISETAQRLCRELAQLNGVLDRVQVNAACDQVWLSNYVDRETIIVCDVEGAEEELLDPLRSKNLTLATIIVEAHDCFRRGLTDALIERFRRTHKISVIVDSGYLERWGALSLEGSLGQLHVSDVLEICNERRLPGQRWLIMWPNEVIGA